MILSGREKADITYLLGESRDSSVVTFLETVIKGAFAPEVIELLQTPCPTFIDRPSPCMIRSIYSKQGESVSFFYQPIIGFDASRASST